MRERRLDIRRVLSLVKYTLFRAYFEHQMLGKADVQFRGRTLRRAKILTTYVVDDAILSIRETAQFHGSLPFRREKAVEHFGAFSDSVCLGGIETNVIELSKILAFRKHLLLVQGEPLRPMNFALGREVAPAAAIAARRARTNRPSELRANH